MTVPRLAARAVLGGAAPVPHVVAHVAEAVVLPVEQADPAAEQHGRQYRAVGRDPDELRPPQDNVPGLPKGLPAGEDVGVDLGVHRQCLWGREGWQVEQDRLVDVVSDFCWEIEES